MKPSFKRPLKRTFKRPFVVKSKRLNLRRPQIALNFSRSRSKFHRKNWFSYVALKKNKRFLRRIRKHLYRRVFNKFYRKVLRPSPARRRNYNAYGMVRRLAGNYISQRAHNALAMPLPLGNFLHSHNIAGRPQPALFKKTSLPYVRLRQLSTKLAQKPWFGQRSAWYWKHLYRIKFSKKFIRIYNRALHLPALRFRFVYLYELFVFWFYFFFKKMECFLFYFFYEMWCNVFFCLRHSSVTGSASKTSFNQLFCKSLVFLVTKLSEVYRTYVSQHTRVYFKARLSLFARFTFTRLFKLSCLFWPRRRQKHNVLELASWRWRKKFRGYKSRNKKRAPWWKKHRKTQFFSTKKSLRWRFRRQHGSHRIRSYGLRASLRRLKPRMLRKLGKRLKFKRHWSPKTLASLWLKKQGPLKLIKGFSRFGSLRPLRVKFFSRRRANLLAQYVERQRLLLAKANSLGFSIKSKRLLFRHLLLFKGARKNISKFKSFKFFKFLCYCLGSKAILKKILSHRHSAYRSRPAKKTYVAGRRQTFYRRLKIRFSKRRGRFIRRRRLARRRPSKSSFSGGRRLRRHTTIIQQRKRRKKLPFLSLTALYNKLTFKKIRVRRLMRRRHRAKARRLSAKLNRRKLLLAGAVKKIFPRKRKNITFSYKILNA